MFFITATIKQRFIIPTFPECFTGTYIMLLLTVNKMYRIKCILSLFFCILDFFFVYNVTYDNAQSVRNIHMVFKKLKENKFSAIDHKKKSRSLHVLSKRPLQKKGLLRNTTLSAAMK